MALNWQAVGWTLRNYAAKEGALLATNQAHG